MTNTERIKDSDPWMEDVSAPLDFFSGACGLCCIIFRLVSSMTVHPLHASRENVKRAERKFDDLKSAINRFIQTNPYSLRIHRDDKLSHIIARRDKDVPDDFAFDVVDIVLRLRAALDKAVVTLVEANDRGTSGVGFPFGSIDRNTGKPEPFPSARMTSNHGIEKKLTPDQWNFIKSQRPYPGGNDALWAINEIANEDKHRKNLVVVSANLDHGFAMRSDASGVTQIDYLAIRPANCEDILSDQEREKVLMSMGAKVSQQQIDHNFRVGVVFGGLLPVAGKNVLTQLNQQIRLTKHILNGLSCLI